MFPPSMNVMIMCWILATSTCHAHPIPSTAALFSPQSGDELKKTVHQCLKMAAGVTTHVTSTPIMPLPEHLQRAVTSIVEQLRAHGDSSKATAMRKYMKDQFAFFGVQSARRRESLERSLRAVYPSTERSAYSAVPPSAVLPLAEALFARNERELHLDAVDILTKRAEALSVQDLPSLERLIMTKSWWDTVDLLASGCVGSVVLRSRRAGSEVMDAWIRSPNMWVRRAALLHQLKYKERTDEERLFGYIRRCLHEREFFITKAIGWVLRQHARLEPRAVQRFVLKHEAELAPLSKREALKHCGPLVTAAVEGSKTKRKRKAATASGRRVRR